MLNNALLFRSVVPAPLPFFSWNRTDGIRDTCALFCRTGSLSSSSHEWRQGYIRKPGWELGWNVYSVDYRPERRCNVEIQRIPVRRAPSLRQLPEIINSWERDAFHIDDADVVCDSGHGTLMFMRVKIDNVVNYIEMRNQFDVLDKLLKQ